MSLESGRSTLMEAYRELKSRWRDTAAVWTDAKSEEFERTYLIELESALKAAVNSMEQMAESLRKARATCELR